MGFVGQPHTSSYQPTMTPILPSSNNDARPLSAGASSPISPPFQRSIGQALANTHAGQDSPVMNETLSVIEEHMQDMSTPRESFMVPQNKAADDSASEYSSHMNDRQSYMDGFVGDDESSSRLTESQVKSWDPRQTASYLRSIGVDSRHCDIFEEQEINGEVLMDMDQAFISMKEFDFGVMGRRLKTWHKIRALQEEARGRQLSQQTSEQSMIHPESSEALPYALNYTPVSEQAPTSHLSSSAEPLSSSYQSQQHVNAYMNEHPPAPPPLQTQQYHNQRSSIHAPSPSSPWRASMVSESPSRPSAAMIREISHSRRHSSISLGNQPPFETPPSPSVGSATPHRRQPSYDHTWTMSSINPLTTSMTAPSSRLHTMRQQSTNDSFNQSLHTDHSSVDLDRGYFSGPENEGRRTRNVLRKRDSQASPGHSRHSSMLTGSQTALTSNKKHSRLSSVDSIRDMTPRITSPAARAYHSKVFGGRMRSASARTPSSLPYSSAVSPTVTNLETRLSPNPQMNASLPPTPSMATANVPDKARKIMGLRAASEAVTGSEKALASPRGPPGFTESPVDSPDGSATPSAQSLDIDNADTSSKGTDGLSTTLVSKTSNRPRPKTKQQTSAYMQGLQSFSPAEARKTADYSGWMKKKSAGILTTWKPRLFVLHGRRLSYYYSENDTAERGVIDISAHKVLVANSDTVTTMHATITGAASTSPQVAAGAASIENSPTDMRSPNVNSAATTPSNTTGLNSGPFYFKLIPPKAGFSRAVQFTRPTVHYFQVDGIVTGRKWMGEMMKATIEHDLSTFETTNKQKTISLAKARARKERPPALWDTEADGSPLPEMDLDPQAAAIAVAAEEANAGLQIQGLSFEKENKDIPQRSSFEGIFDEKEDLSRPVHNGTVAASDTAPVMLPVAATPSHGAVAT